MKRAAAVKLVLLMAIMGVHLFAPEAVSARDGIQPYRLPVARTLLSKKKILRPHHDHPAWDFNTRVGTKAFSVQAGRVVAVLGGGSCGTGVVIDGFDDFRYTYCHASKALVRGGQRLDSGDPVIRTGNSGSSGTPHLHLEIETTPQLRLKCPQPLLLSWWRGKQMSPKKAPFGGCTN